VRRGHGRDTSVPRRGPTYQPGASPRGIEAPSESSPERAAQAQDMGRFIPPFQASGGRWPPRSRGDAPGWIVGPLRGVKKCSTVPAPRPSLPRRRGPCECQDRRTKRVCSSSVRRSNLCCLGHGPQRRMEAVTYRWRGQPGAGRCGDVERVIQKRELPRGPDHGTAPRSLHDPGPDDCGPGRGHPTVHANRGCRVPHVLHDDSGHHVSLCLSIGTHEPWLARTGGRRTISGHGKGQLEIRLFREPCDVAATYSILKMAIVIRGSLGCCFDVSGARTNKRVSVG
jgi:hypothetical protein